MLPEQNENKAVILFDGVCNLCNAAVQKVIKHDKHDYFRFASLQSDVGMQLLIKHQLPPLNIPDSIVLIEKGKAYQYSSAALRIAKKLSLPYNLLYPLLIVPAFLRNLIYKFIAKRRYKWFGKQEICWVPTPELRNKFL